MLTEGDDDIKMIFCSVSEAAALDYLHFTVYILNDFFAHILKTVLLQYFRSSPFPNQLRTAQIDQLKDKNESQAELSKT